ncbi:peptide ABC transporter substrate-binding protein [Rhodobacterales bacterium HKCCSP123]|nr:peptide ABC transporter substrate-binding protein [Rhodobacterales bacterium HKCCSP123]
MAERCRIAQKRVSTGDPHDCTDAADQLSVLRALCGALVRREGRTHKPQLASGWEVDASARTWSFRLREGQRFHDGSPFDAAAVARSLERMARADKGYTLGAPGVWRQYLGGARIEAVGADTVAIGLAEPVADLLDILEQGFIVAPATLDTWDSGGASDIIGAGPYRVTSRTGTSIRASRVLGHVLSPRFEEVEWIAEPDATRRLDMLREGTVDIACDLPPGGPDMTADGRPLTLLDNPSPVAIILLLNCSRGPLADARLRRALNLAVDRESLVRDVLGGHGAPLHGFVSSAHVGADGGAPIRHDPAAARRLLADAGYQGGVRLGIDCPTRLPDEAESLCKALARQLADVGITLEIHVHADREAYAHMVRRKDIRDACVFDSSPMSTFRVLYEKIDSRVAGSWWQGYRNPSVEHVLDAARRETSHAARGRLYAEAYAMLQADPPWLTLYTQTRRIGLGIPAPGFRMPSDGILDVTDLPPLPGGADHRM